MIRIGSCFSGIGGFELGLERAISGAKTVWQIEQNKFCQKVLAKHWPNAVIYDDIKTINTGELEKVDILCGGFPCQDLSYAGNRKGLYDGKKSSLWFDMLKIISDLQPRVVCLENVSGIFTLGIGTVLGGLAKIGYNSEWQVIRASDFGAPHQRKRWFAVAYPIGTNSQFKPVQSVSMEQNKRPKRQSHEIHELHERGGYFTGFPSVSPVCRRDDGIPYRVDRIRALGNAIVPQCSEYIGKLILKSGILNNLEKGVT